jgi:hypothetical protein
MSQIQNSTQPMSSASNLASANFLGGSTPAAPVLLGLDDFSTGSLENFGLGGVSHDASPVVVFTAVAGDTISLYDNGTLLGTMVAQAGVNGWKIPTTLSNGVHDLMLTDTNAAGVTSAALNVPFTVEAVTPAAPVLLGLDDFSTGSLENFGLGGVSHDASPVVVFTAAAGDTISLYDNGTLLGTMVAQAGVNGWKIPTTLSNGVHDLMLTDTNPAGVTSAALNVPFTVQAAEPSASTEASDATVLSSSQQAVSHASIGEHDAFKGTAGGATVELNADPASYFKESSAHIQGATDGVNTLHLVGDHQVLDMTSLTGQTAAAKVSGMQAVDLGGHSNALTLSLVDVLNLGEPNLFQNDGNKQMLVSGSNGDTVSLSNTHLVGVTDGEWQQHGTAQVGGVTYNVYEHEGAHAELLVQQGVQVALHH